MQILRKTHSYFIICFLFFSLQINAQIANQDSVKAKAIISLDSVSNEKKTKTDSIQKLKFKINPRLATKRSAMIPGWGQVYIKQAWFVPVIYGGFAITGYYVANWNKKYKAFRTEYFRVSNYNANKANTTPLTEGKVTINGLSTTYSIANLKAGTNFYRKNRDGTMLIFPVIWAANILQVNVWAHLKTFDLSDDITMKIEPSIEPNIAGLPNLGAKVVFAFK
jgi:Family of unknown function (DUF5683)